MADNQVESVKQGVDIVEVIGERVNLKRAGRNFKGLCPFHGEKTPSFFVSPEMQIYKCFGCGAAGDVFNFLQNSEGMTFPEALETLAKRAGIKLTYAYQSGEDKQRGRLLEVMHLATEMYHYLLTEHEAGQKALAYLKERQVSRQLITDFKLGYAPNQWQMLRDYLVRKKGYTAEELLTAGLVVKSAGGKLYDRFRGRVVFPQMTQNGVVVGLAGRLLDPQVKEAKYVNSPETPIYHKGAVLYGLYQARAAIRKAKRAVVVEGEFDVLSSVKANLKETVAIKGSAVTQEQGLLLKRLAPTVVLALDADSAGQEAMLKAIELAEPMGLTMLVVAISDGKDPDEAALKDPGQWRDKIKEAVSVYTFMIETACQRFKADTGPGQKEITKMVLPLLNRIENKVEQAFYVRQLAQKLKVNERMIEEEMVKIKAGVKETKVETEVVRMSRRERLERYVIGIGLHLGDAGKPFWQNLEPNWFGEAYLKQLATKLKQKQLTAKTAEEQWWQGLPPEWQASVSELYAADESWFSLSQTEVAKWAKKAAADLHRLALKEELTSLSRSIAKTSDSAQEGEWRRRYRAVRQELATLEAAVN